MPPKYMLTLGPQSSRLTKEQRDRFARHVRGLNKLMEEISDEYSDAEYYLTPDNLNLMIGPTHAGRDDVAQQGNVAVSITLLYGSGGDW